MIKKHIDYYESLLDIHGPGPEGVGWNGREAQEIRFAQLCHLFSHDNFSVNDLGCGTGDLAHYLKSRYRRVDYTGFDMIPRMIDLARVRLQGPNIKFKLLVNANEAFLPDADYTLASGIFNLKFDQTVVEWEKHILLTLTAMNESSRRGFAFNALTKYSDKPMMKTGLFYADPLWLFDFCKKNFSRNVALLHDYDLYDFTILVRK